MWGQTSLPSPKDGFELRFLRFISWQQRCQKEKNNRHKLNVFFSLHLHVEVHVQREELGVRTDNVAQPPPTTSCRAYRWQKATQVWLSRRSVPPAGHRNQFKVKSVRFLGGGHQFGDGAPDEDIWPAGPRLAVRPSR